MGEPLPRPGARLLVPSAGQLFRCLRSVCGAHGRPGWITGRSGSSLCGGSHTNLRGSYLAACVFYATFYGESPVGNPFRATLSPGDAAFLQQCAAEAVFAPTCGAAPYSGAGLPGANVLTLDALGDPDLGGSFALRTTGIHAGANVAWHYAGASTVR